MNEVFKEFLLFGVVEVFIFVLFAKKVLMFDNAKYRHVIIIGFFLMLCGLLNIPFFKQISGIVILTIYYAYLKKKMDFKCFLYGLESMLYILIVEATIYFLLDSTNIIDVTIIKNNIDEFVCLIPVRIIEISILFIYNKIKAVK